MKIINEISDKGFTTFFLSEELGDVETRIEQIPKKLSRKPEYGTMERPRDVEVTTTTVCVTDIDAPVVKKWLSMDEV